MAIELPFYVGGDQAQKIIDLYGGTKSGELPVSMFAHELEQIVGGPENVETLIADLSIGSGPNRMNMISSVTDAGYDMDDFASTLKDFYESSSNARIITNKELSEFVIPFSQSIDNVAENARLRRFTDSFVNFATDQGITLKQLTEAIIDDNSPLRRQMLEAGISKGHIARLEWAAEEYVGTQSMSMDSGEIKLSHADAELPSAATNTPFVTNGTEPHQIT